MDVMVAAPAPNRLVRIDDFRPDLPEVDGAFECTGREAIGQTPVGRQVLGSGAISFSAAFPSSADSKATVVVVVDSTGKLLHYAERRGAPIRVIGAGGTGSVPSPAQVAAAAEAQRSTVITLDFPRGQGIIVNRGGGLPDEMARGPVGIVGSMARFGVPLERAERVLARCREGR